MQEQEAGQLLCKAMASQLVTSSSKGASLEQLARAWLQAPSLCGEVHDSNPSSLLTLGIVQSVQMDLGTSPAHHSCKEVMEHLSGRCRVWAQRQPLFCLGSIT